MMKNIIIMMTVFLLIGCFYKKTVKPKDVDETVDVCARCHMAIKNSGYADEIVTTDGKYILFDDIGCLYGYIKENPLDKIAARFVQDVNTKEWIVLDKGYYAINDDIPTPMSYGIHAFKDKETRDKFITDNGKGEALDYKALETRDWNMKMKMKM